MGGKIEFVRNYRDLSTSQGFQFEFHCDKCHSGFRTRFQPSVVGTVAGVLDTAGSLFGGIFGKAAHVTDRFRSASWEMSHDDAFSKAVEEIKPDFIQCPRCSGWVCRKACWNNRKGLCKNCAPDLGVEMSAAQSEKAVREIWNQAESAEEDRPTKQSWKENIRASCPQCEASLPSNVKFCPECGAKLKKTDLCPSCGTKLPPKVKFCPECGERTQ